MSSIKPVIGLLPTVAYGPLHLARVRDLKRCNAGRSSSGTEASTISGSTFAIWNRLVVLSTIVSCSATFCSMM